MSLLSMKLLPIAEQPLVLYAVLHVPPESQAALQEVVDEICLEAKRVGIGVIVAEIPGDYQTWEELLRPPDTNLILSA